MRLILSSILLIPTVIILCSVRSCSATKCFNSLQFFKMISNKMCLCSFHFWMHSLLFFCFDSVAFLPSHIFYSIFYPNLLPSSELSPKLVEGAERPRPLRGLLSVARSALSQSSWGMFLRLLLGPEKLSSAGLVHDIGVQQHSKPMTRIDVLYFNRLSGESVNIWGNIFPHSHAEKTEKFKQIGYKIQ